MTPEVAILVLLTYPIVALSWCSGAWDRARWTHLPRRSPAATLSRRSGERRDNHTRGES